MAEVGSEQWRAKTWRKTLEAHDRRAWQHSRGDDIHCVPRVRLPQPRAPSLPLRRAQQRPETCRLPQAIGPARAPTSHGIPSANDVASSRRVRAPPRRSRPARTARLRQDNLLAVDRQCHGELHIKPRTRARFDRRGRGGGGRTRSTRRERDLASAKSRGQIAYSRAYR